MAACGSLQHIFEKPLPENPTLMDTLSSWNQIKSMKPPEQPSFTEIFGELHFKENSELLSSSSYLSSPHPPTSSSSSSLPSTSSTSSLIDFNPQLRIEKNENLGEKGEENKGPLNLYVSRHRNSDSFSSMKSESLQLCTEGLGFESCDDVEDVHNEIKDDWENQEERVTRHSPRENAYTEFRRSRTQGGAFPPPISCIGKSGKPWVSFKSYRHDGRFVLKEIRIPNQELLHACREDGRLKLHFVQPDEEILEEDEEQDVEDTDNEDEYDDNDEEDNDENGEHEAEISHDEAKGDSCFSPFQGELQIKLGK